MNRWCAEVRMLGRAKGRRTARTVAEDLPDDNYVTAIRMQRFCGQRLRGPRRQIFVAGVETSQKERRGRSNRGVRTVVPRDRAGASLPQKFRALHATCTLPTVFPSLRAHEPNPAELEIHPDLAGEMLEKQLLRPGAISGRTQETNFCEAVQLTNRRMRTFIATPSARNVNNTEDPP